MDWTVQNSIVLAIFAPCEYHVLKQTWLYWMSLVNLHFLIYFDDNMDKILFSTVLGTPTGPICIDTLEAPKGLVSFANFVTPVGTYTQVCCIWTKYAMFKRKWH